LLKRIGVPTPEPLAYVETKKHGLVRESFLIMPCINGVNFHHYIRNENLLLDQKRRVVEQIKGIMDALTWHKISHGDTKLSNFLVADEGPVVTDLDSMKVHWSGVMARRGAKNDLARFMLGINTDDISAQMRQICADAMGYNGPLPYHFTNNYFSMCRQDDWALLVRRGFHPDDAVAIVDGDVCRDEKRYTRRQSSEMAKVWTTTAHYRDKTISVYIKLHLQRSVVDFVKHLFRAGRGRRAFAASLMLRRNGLDCPEPLALLEKRLGPFCAESILVTEGIPDCVQLYTHLQRLATEGTARAEIEKRTIIRQLGEYAGKMHRAGIFHGDLRLGNIMLQNDNGRWRFYLIDNERTRQVPVLPGRLVIKNLVQLNMFRVGVSNTDRMRFLKAYNEQVKLTDNCVRRLCKHVIQKTNKRMVIRELHHPS
jgi:tRNA A-37 threonylcarbamoyl transferase component Bud32